MAELQEQIKLEDVSSSYGKRPILSGISFSAKPGMICALVGPNGAGKSTLLKTVAGFITPLQGRIFYMGKDISRLAAHNRARIGIGYMLQGGGVFNSLTVKENIELSVANLPNKFRRKYVDSALSIIPRLSSAMGTPAGLLSGGQRSLLAFAMTFARMPRLMLLDEPLAGLSPDVVSELISSVISFARENCSTVLLVEQNIPVAIRAADRVLVLQNGRLEGDYPASDTNLEKKIEEAYFGKSLLELCTKEQNSK